ncbi:fatty-acyl-CoA synthase [Geodermatophilus pulveris]|uniref:Fatty-acyl-CoA synthase n=1 Tax=Geodermatophilus pulveris TaxID=1564159 RepID=A0A239C7M2_9ACTN|nr:acyl-CoA synthetase [Geodermatophilus pulveris]SNS15939.1 fatty-acyl-CoA synthase [Geodermatophilus pulveris]
MFDEALTQTVARARGHALGDLLRRSAARVPDRTALRFRDRSHTYAELDAAVDRTANALTARGVARGDRVALLSHNDDGYVVLTFALARLGAVAVPVNFMLTAGEVAYILEHCGATGVVAEAALVPVAQEALRLAGREEAVAVRGVLGGGPDGGPAGWEAYETWAAHPDGAPPEVDVADDDVLQLMYTSGTESRPKGVMMTSRSLVTQYVSCIVDGRYAADDVALHALPLFHVAAQHVFLVPNLYLGGTNVVLDGPDPATVLATVERERITSLFCPPTVWIGLLRHPDFDRRDLSSLAKGYYGASIMPVATVEELSRRLPGMALFNCYGQTEMSALALVLSPEDQLRKLGSAGTPALNSQTRLVDDLDRPVGPGVEGEIVHRSPHATVGYWNDPAKTAEAFRGGWFHSGDLGVMDEDGYITVVDRKKDVIKTGGENVASREVEEVLYQHPAVAETAVFGIPHPRWIEAVAAVVVPRDGQRVDPDELVGFCRERLAGYKTPRYVAVVDGLPKNASGKILKRELRTTFAHLAG